MIIEAARLWAKRCGESWRLTQVGRRAPFLAPSALAHIHSASSILPRRSTLIGYEPKLNDSGLFTFLVNAINVWSALHKLSLYDGHDSDDLILSWSFSSRQRISNHFQLSTYMFSGWAF